METINTAPIKDLRGWQLVPVAVEYPKFPCWCYHTGLGFCYMEYDSREHAFTRYPYSLLNSNIKVWLKPNPNTQ